MPTYEYACTACGHRLEAVQSFTDDPLTECPDCSGALRKVYSPVGIVLKGSGFYKTDSRAAAKSNGNGKSAEATKSDDSSKSGDSTKTDSPKGGADSSTGGGDTNKSGADSSKNGGSTSKEAKPAASAASSS